MKILFIGSYPPPYGGVATHIKRLTEILSEKDNEITIIDIYIKEMRSINLHLNIIPLRLRYIGPIIKSFISSDIVHIHNAGYGKYWREALIVLFSKLINKKIIITIHGGFFPQYVANASIVSKYFLKLWIKLSDQIIFVNELQQNAIYKYVSEKTDSKYKIIPAYIPETKKFDDEMKYLASNNKSKPNGYKILVMGSWLELYGFDVFLHAIKRLVDQGFNIKGYILPINNCQPNLQYRSTIESLITNLNLGENIAFLHETDDINSIYNAMDIFVRPTYTDGDSMSVREAISCGVPVIASDVCKRPENVIIFKNKDSVDLAHKLKQVLDNLKVFKASMQNYDSQNYSHQLLSIYNNLSKT